MRNERGVALVEIALVAPVVFLLIFAVIEFGLVFRDQLTAQDAVSDAARAGAIVGPDVTTSGTNADYEIVRALRDGLGNIPTSWIDTIVVFRGNPAGAGSPESQITAACRNGSTGVSGVCNVYEPNDAFVQVQAGNVGWFDCAVNTSSPACRWPPSTRDDGPDPADIDYVGVYIRIERSALTGFFGSTHTVERASVIRLEPGAVEAP